MNSDSKSVEVHRIKADGSANSLCLNCLSTISPQASGSAGQGYGEHICSFTFPSRRAGKLPEGIKKGRRKSDQIWEANLSSPIKR